ncbi:MAG: transcription termination/antitermination NusG family protein [Akkermansiaceae bacterium]|nr:transcription termination/antitermination NusG family protein [Akkermansiaceae bacterium]
MVSPAHSTQQWYCVRTQVKREQVAASHLRQLPGVEVLCPRLRYRKSTARGRIWWNEPLFPGYVMARFELDAMKRQVNTSTGVRGLVHFGQQVPAVPDAFVEEMKHELLEHAENDTLTTTPTIEIGDEVQVNDGPLRGMSGIIVEVLPAKERVQVLLEFLGESHAVELDLFSLLLPRRPQPGPAKPSEEPPTA